MKGLIVRIDPKDLKDCDIIIDGPSLAYYICDDAIKPGVMPEYGSYKLFRDHAIEVIEGILKLSPRRVRVYFDGFLPEEKYGIRDQRSRTAISERNRVFRPSFASTMLYQLLYEEYKTDLDLLKFVADEADEAVAADVTGPNVVVLSSDSDFYAYKFTPQDVRLVNLRGADFTSEPPLIEGVTLSQKTTLSLVNVCHRRDPPKHVRESILGPECLVPRVHEFANGMMQFGSLVSYMPVIKEVVSMAPAFEVGRLYRSWAYTAIIRRLRAPKANKVKEYYRVGSSFACKPLDIFLDERPEDDPLNYDYEEEYWDALSDREGLISELVREVTETRGGISNFEPIVRKYLTTAFDDDLTEEEPVLRISQSQLITPKLVQTFARLQAALFSIMFLESAGIRVPIAVGVRTWHIDWTLYLSICSEFPTLLQ
ncbi:hypothetical protein TRVA0_031S01596 [Trichomonascus vanleenenianus]|uniref:uncharacterized protein n=1 Tax=Trichomonascus vanleenenianus TaxID=2268995 RepID=UPI003ECA7166